MKRETKPTPAALFLDQWVMGAVAKAARDSCPRDVAFSAFLSEIASIPSLRRYLP